MFRKGFYKIVLLVGTVIVLCSFSFAVAQSGISDDSNSPDLIRSGYQCYIDFTDSFIECKNDPQNVLFPLAICDCMRKAKNKTVDCLIETCEPEAEITCEQAFFWEMLYCFRETNNGYDCASLLLCESGVYDRYLECTDSYIFGREKSNNSHLPQLSTLTSNYPNPFNATTVISYEIPGAGNVKLDIYNLLGQKVETLVEEYQEKGKYEVVWDGYEISSGIYFYKLTTQDVSLAKRMVLLK